MAFLNKSLAYYNQDVDLANRGIGKMYDPEEHMLWNLNDLAVLEHENADYKNLIDRMRVEGLMEYYISKRYHKDAQLLLSKVDWTQRSPRDIRKYKTPMMLLCMKYKFLKIGSIIKSKVYG